MRQCGKMLLCAWVLWSLGIPHSGIIVTSIGEGLPWQNRGIYESKAECVAAEKILDAQFKAPRTPEEQEAEKIFADPTRYLDLQCLPAGVDPEKTR